MSDSVMRQFDLAAVHDIPVLNQRLYEALCRRFNEVQVAKQGTPLLGGAYVIEGGRRKFKATEAGEYYRVNCFVCNDTRARLWINHRWGVGLDPSHYAYDPTDKFWWACVCFNENCMENPAHVAQLRTWTYGGVGRELHGQEIKIAAGCAAPAVLNVITLPGKCVRIDGLSEHHVANAYLRSRGFDPKILGTQYCVHYCEEAPVEYPAANGRIIIPIYMQGHMVGWQARAPYDVDWKARHIPKYYNCQFSKSNVLYGYDKARGAKFCVVVEGPSDVWALGGSTIATLGKTLSYVQAELIRQNWQAAVIAYDGDAHANVQLAQALLAGSMPVVPVLLPEGTDPATLPREQFWSLVRHSAAANHIELA